MARSKAIKGSDFSRVTDAAGKEKWVFVGAALHPGITSNHCRATIGNFCIANRDAVVAHVVKVVKLPKLDVEKMFTDVIEEPTAWVRWKRVRNSARVQRIKDVGPTVEMRIFKHTRYPALRIAVLHDEATDKIVRVMMDETLE